MKKLLLSLSFFIFANTAMAATQAEIQKINNKINSITTMESDFTQYNTDGTVSKGSLKMRRPGRLRMDYQNPKDPMVIVSGSAINIYDGQRDSSPEVYPLKKTPLWLLLKKNTNIASSRALHDVSEKDGKLLMSIWDAEIPEAGQIVFIFDKNNLDLEGWVSYPGNGEHIRVTLDNPKFGTQLPNSIFSSGLEKDKRNSGR